MELEGSLTWTWKPGLYPKPDKFIPHHYTLFQVVSFFHVSQLIFLCISHLSYACYIPIQSHPPWLYHRNNIQVQVLFKLWDGKRGWTGIRIGQHHYAFILLTSLRITQKESKNCFVNTVSEDNKVLHLTAGCQVVKVPLLYQVSLLLKRPCDIIWETCSWKRGGGTG